MEIKINSLCPHELVSEDNGGGVKFNNGLDLQGLYLYEKYYPHKLEAKFNARIAAGKPNNVSQDNWDNDVADMQSELNWMKTAPVGIVFKNAAVTQGAISEIWPGVSGNDESKSNKIYTSPTEENYIDPTTGSTIPGDLSWYANGHIQDVSYYSYSPIYIREYFSDNSTISKSSYNGKKISVNGITEDLLKSKLEDINAADALWGDYPITDKYLLCIEGNYRLDGRDFWDIGGKEMTTNKNGGLCPIYSKYGTGGVNWLVQDLMSENDVYFAKMVFCFKQMVDNTYDYTRNHTDLLSTCSNIEEYDPQYSLGTVNALNNAVNNGDAVFVYRDDLLNFTNFVQKKLGVTVEQIM